MSAGDRDPLEVLTPREREIALHVGAGLRNKEIGTLLGDRSHDTIRVHLANIARKWQLDSALDRRVAIARVVWRRGIGAA